MGPNGFESVQQAIDKIDAIVHQMIDRDTEEMRMIQASIRELGQKLGGDYSASISLCLTVKDQFRTRELPFDILTFTSDRGEEPYDSTEESSPQRYVIGDAECVVPRDRCPRCWQSWPHKFQHPYCPHCDLKLGNECTVIVESEECPQCEDGTVSVERPVCDECGHEVDLRSIVWD